MPVFPWLVPDASQLPATSTALVPGQIDHVAAALSRLPFQFQDKQGIIDLLTIFAQRYNDLEAVLQALLTGRNILNPATIGVQLDQIGDIVGQPRNGLDDPTYQLYLLARILTNKSVGTIENLISIAVIILNNLSAQVIVTITGPAALIVRIGSVTITDALANTLLDFLQAATAAGVRLILQTAYALDADLWYFALAAFLTGNTLVGATTIAVDSTANFPVSGTLNVDEALATADLGVTYSGVTPTSFLNVTGLAHAHSATACVTLVDGLKGMGDTANPTTVGGELSSARDSHYP